MALSLMRPNVTKQEDLGKCGIGLLPGMDLSQMHVAIAVCIDGGPVTQEEQRTITTMVDEAVFDLRRRGADWTKNTAILIVRFPDSESFVKSLNGERNLVRATGRFPTRQRDNCIANGVCFTMGLAWEVPAQANLVPLERGPSMLRPEMTIEEALAVKNIDPATLLQMAELGDTVGVQRMIDAATFPIEQATTSWGYSPLHACAIHNFADTADAILKAQCNQQYLDMQTVPARVTPLFFAAQHGSYDVAKLLLEKGATVD